MREDGCFPNNCLHSGDYDDEVGVLTNRSAYLACLSGMMVGGFGGCWGKISPRRMGPRWGMDMSPADRSDITPCPSRPFDV